MSGDSGAKIRKLSQTDKYTRGSRGYRRLMSPHGPEHLAKPAAINPRPLSGADPPKHRNYNRQYNTKSCPRRLPGKLTDPANQLASLRFLLGRDDLDVLLRAVVDRCGAGRSGCWSRLGSSSALSIVRSIPWF